VLWLIKRRETCWCSFSRRSARARGRWSNARICGNVDTTDPCAICADPRRDRARFAWSRTSPTSGRSTARGCSPGATTCSAADFRARTASPEDLSIGQLIERVCAAGIDEVVLAMNATLEGQTTAHYIAERLESFPSAHHPARPRPARRRRARLLDEGTLAQALRARRPVS
jgi:recombination protein RecR